MKTIVIIEDGKVVFLAIGFLTSIAVPILYAGFVEIAPHFVFSWTVSWRLPFGKYLSEIYNFHLNLDLKWSILHNINLKIFVFLYYILIYCYFRIDIDNEHSENIEKNLFYQTCCIYRLVEKFLLSKKNTVFGT